MAINNLAKRIQLKQPIPISKFRFWAGFVVSILLSFSLYQFFIIGRDNFRFYTLSDNFNYLEFTDKELFFYNLFYAFLSLIIVQSFFLKIIFDTNKNFGEKRIQFKRKKIVHDQNSLIWLFLYWFLKLAVFYGIMNMNSLYWGDYTFSIYEHLNFFEEYPYLFLLIILVLFLQSWQSLGVTLCNYFKNMIGSFVFISIVAFAFSQINVVDFESYLKKQHAENPYIKENIELPLIDNYDHFYVNTIKGQIFINQNFEIFYKENKVPLKTLIDSLVELENKPYYNYYKNSLIRLNIDKDLPIDSLYKLKSKILFFTSFEIFYSTYSKSNNFNKSYFQDSPIGIKDSLLLNKQQIDFTSKFISNFKNIISLKQDNFNNIVYHDTIITVKQIEEKIKNSILLNNDYIITLELKKNATFSDYITLLTLAKKGYTKAYFQILKESKLEDYMYSNSHSSILDFRVLDIHQPHPSLELYNLPKVDIKKK